MVTDTNENRIAEGTCTLDARRRMATLLSAEACNVGSVVGAFTFTASDPWAVIALRGTGAPAAITAVGSIRGPDRRGNDARQSTPALSARNRLHVPARVAPSGTPEYRSPARAQRQTIR